MKPRFPLGVNRQESGAGRQRLGSLKAALLPSAWALDLGLLSWGGAGVRHKKSHRCPPAALDLIWTDSQKVKGCEGPGAALPWGRRASWRRYDRGGAQSSEQDSGAK